MKVYLSRAAMVSDLPMEGFIEVELPLPRLRAAFDRYRQVRDRVECWQEGTHPLDEAGEAELLLQLDKTYEDLLQEVYKVVK